MLRNKRILITGGAGFIGSHIIESLIGENEITVIDTFSQNAVKYTDFEKNKNLRLVKGDVLDEKLLAQHAKDVDMVIHMAAIAGVANVIGHPSRTISVNLIGTYKVLEAFKKSGLERFVNFSTSEVYGPQADNVDEQSLTSQGPVGDPRWTYAVSKVAAEHLGYRYMQEFGLPFVSVRPFNVYGPRQVGGGAVKIFVEKAISSITLAKKIIEKAGSKSAITFKKDVKEDVLVRIPKIDKARRLLGYGPKVMLDEGLEKTVAWYKSGVGR
ncbi:MAG: NAD-dependent epimerase/dehydratase family protein [Candidatus Micrarchaeota archaeon]|nr:NAD-dependent epimerase/dehydratase family protein [Candidatus Micrarchaeota archaeon]